MGTQTTQTNAPQSPAERAGTVGHETKQASQDVAATAGHEAQRVTREAKDQVQQLWGQTRSQLNDQAATQQSRAASGLRELADQLGQMADSADQDGMARGLVDDVARRAHEAASWLDQRDPGSLLEEVRTYARRRPGAFLAIAAGVGLVAGRMSRSLVEEARDSDGSSTGTPSLGSTGAGSGGTGYASGTTGYASGTTGYGSGSTGLEPGNGGGYGAGSLAGTGTAGTGIPTATSPTSDTTASTPVTAGSTPSAVSEGMATTPSGDLPGPHRTTQPVDPDGTPSPIGSEGQLTAEGDDPLRGDR